MVQYIRTAKLPRHPQGCLHANQDYAKKKMPTEIEFDNQPLKTKWGKIGFGVPMSILESCAMVSLKRRSNSFQLRSVRN
eukprot:287149-Amphidinium_carterae.1